MKTIYVYIKNIFWAARWANYVAGKSGALRKLCHLKAIPNYRKLVFTGLFFVFCPFKQKFSFGLSVKPKQRTLTVGEESLYGWSPVWQDWIWPRKKISSYLYVVKQVESKLVNWRPALVQWSFSQQWVLSCFT